MGQKASPIAMRLGIIRSWDSIWWDSKRVGQWVVEDEKIRRLVNKKFRKAEIERVKIERNPGFLRVIIHTGKPALLIGQKGSEIDSLRKEIFKLVDKKSVQQIDIKIEGVKNTNVSAQIVATNLALQIERNTPYKRAMKKAIADALKDGAKGIKIMVSGRLGGAEMARDEWYSEGRMPSQTLRADIDYALGEAYTKYGVIGVKVWIFKGERLGKVSLFNTEKKSLEQRPQKVANKRRAKPSSKPLGKRRRVRDTEEKSAEDKTVEKKD
ncbi:MAG TPA: 30S ribosomal protein S3 [Spirochaetota bacterium]|nr:30S ribosomal protein S3 [Spirochaetota bacterium]HOM37920.1 30S ribosomal protein S3 [Spirochaetota bacterium]HPQ48724.1 30S ribosomal protein S3 [Spirochaetota bacterium]